MSNNGAVPACFVVWTSFELCFTTVLFVFFLPHVVLYRGTFPHFHTAALLCIPSTSCLLLPNRGTRSLIRLVTPPIRTPTPTPRRAHVAGCFLPLLTTIGPKKTPSVHHCLHDITKKLRIRCLVRSGASPVDLRETTQRPRQLP